MHSRNFKALLPCLIVAFCLPISANAGSISDDQWLLHPRQKTSLLIKTHLQRIGSFLYGSSAEIRFYLHRMQGSPVSQQEVLAFTSKMSPEEYKELIAQAYESSLERAVRSIQILYDLASNSQSLQHNPEFDPFDSNYHIRMRKGVLTEHKGVLNTSYAFRAFPHFPDLQTDVERILEIDGIVGQFSNDLIKMHLEEIYQEHHPDCRQLLTR